MADNSEKNCFLALDQANRDWLIYQALQGLAPAPLVAPEPEPEPQPE